MITEDYCSYEVAKLLKEKGFDEQTVKCYNLKKELCACQCIGNGTINSTPNYLIATPTQSMAMKWLREVHNIFICIIPCEVGAGVMDYTYVLYKIDAKNFYFEDLCIQGRAENISEISYEKTVEAAIKYCLENLI